MVRREGNGIQAKIMIPDTLRGDKDDRVGPNRQLTFETISDWIKLQGFDEYTETGLIELASRYPTSALKSFRKNFNLMLARVRENRKREQNQQENDNANDISETEIIEKTSEEVTEEISVETSESNEGRDSREQDSFGTVSSE